VSYCIAARIILVGLCDGLDWQDQTCRFDLGAFSTWNAPRCIIYIQYIYITEVLWAKELCIGKRSVYDV
jgi:hypothetical protein